MRIQLVAALLLAGCTGTRNYHRVVVMSDPHLPGNILPAKEEAVREINAWNDVDLVAVTGDIVSKGGSPAEFAFASQFLRNVSKPLRVMGGNHDYLYPDDYPLNPATRHALKEGSPEARRQKLERFKETWGLKELHSSERLGKYLLVFLTPDDLVSNNFTQLSDGQLAWLDAELRRNKALPTIVFFHGPLEGTYRTQRILRAATPDSYNAEPASRIREILLRNRQVFMWVSGHLHLAPSSPSFRSEINQFEKQVWVIHNADMNGDSIRSDTDRKKPARHDTIWTSSLFLYPDRVVVKTYDHKQGLWLDELERTIRIPAGS